MNLPTLTPPHPIITLSRWSGSQVYHNKRGKADTLRWWWDVTSSAMLEQHHHHSRGGDEFFLNDICHQEILKYFFSVTTEIPTLSVRHSSSHVQMLAIIRKISVRLSNTATTWSKLLTLLSVLLIILTYHEDFLNYWIPLGLFSHIYQIRMWSTLLIEYIHFSKYSVYIATLFSQLTANLIYYKRQ